MTDPPTAHAPQWPPRPLREDEELLTGRIARLNDKGLQLEGEGGRWRNFGALKVAERLEVGATVELVTRNQWVNFVRLVDATPGDDTSNEVEGEVPF